MQIKHIFKFNLWFIIQKNHMHKERIRLYRAIYTGSSNINQEINIYYTLAKYQYTQSKVYTLRSRYSTLLFVVTKHHLNVYKLIYVITLGKLRPNYHYWLRASYCQDNCCCWDLYRLQDPTGGTTHHISV